MAHYAGKCAHCTDFHRKCVRTRMEDENGDVFYGQMYECGNTSCRVNREISHIQRDIQITDRKMRKGAKKYEEDHYDRT